MKILIADDERANISELSHILKPEHTILIAKDGRQALSAANTNTPDLILLDINMPGMTGFDVLSVLKDSDNTRHIPVIFITGRDRVEDEIHGFFLGAADYITKPFHSAIVKARVRNHLQNVEYIRRIEQLGMIDVLTDLCNRRGYDAHFAREWERAVREKISISIIVADVDGFKQFNDQFGHPRGDEILTMVGGVFRQNLKRATDIASRWGGDEFAALLPNTDESGVLDVAEKIRAGVESLDIHNGTGDILSLSMGVNAIIPTPECKPSEFFAAADNAVYISKKNGKNRVSRS